MGDFKIETDVAEEPESLLTTLDQLSGIPYDGTENNGSTTIPSSDSNPCLPSAAIIQFEPDSPTHSGQGIKAEPVDQCVSSDTFLHLPSLDQREETVDTHCEPCTCVERSSWRPVHSWNSVSSGRCGTDFWNNSSTMNLDVHTDSVPSNSSTDVSKTYSVTASITSDVIKTEAVETNISSDVIKTEAVETNISSDVIKTEAAETNISSDVIMTEAVTANIISDVIMTEAVTANIISDVITTEAVTANIISDVITTEAVTANIISDVITTEAVTANISRDVIKTDAVTDITMTVTCAAVQSDSISCRETDVDRPHGDPKLKMCGEHFYHLVEWAMEEGATQPSVSVVPENWVMKGTSECSWPRNGSAAHVKKNPLPDVSWPSYKYSRIIRSSKNWQQIKHWETQLLEKADVETADHSDYEETSRKRKRHTRVVYSPSPRSPSSGEDSPSPLKRHRDHPSSPPPLSPPPPPSQPNPVPSTSSLLSPSPVRDELPPMPVDQSTASDMRSYFEAVLQQIGALRTEFATEIASLKKEVQALRQRTGEGEGEGNEGLSRPKLPQGFSFPLTTKEELERLNQQLAADTAVQRRLERYLYNLGGITYKHSLRAAGSVLIAPSLQGQYNMTGTNRFGQNKANFSQLQQVNRVLFNAVQERHDVTTQQMKTYLSDWLATWRDRVPGGKSKPKTVMVVVDNPAEANVEIV